MLSDSRRSRGLPVPSIGQWLMTAVALCIGWFVWSEYDLRSDVVDLSHPPADPVKYLQAVETVVERGRDGVPDLVAALSSENTKARVYAIYALGRIGPQAREAIAAVRDHLNDENAGVREMAAVALRHLFPQREDVAPVIASLLDDSDANVRKAVSNELVDLGAAARPTIVALLESDQSTLRRQAIRILRAWRLAEKVDVLAEVGPAVRRLTIASEPEVQGEARMALVEWGIAEVGDIRSLLHSGEAERIEVALKGLASLRLAVRPLLPDLFELLDDPQIESVPVAPSYAAHPWLRPLLELLNSQKTASRPAAPRLFRLLAVRRDRDRVFIARMLRAIDADREETVRAYGALVRDADSRVAREASRLLIEVSPEAARRHVSLLVCELKEVEKSKIPEIIDAIGHLGPQAGDAVTALVPLLAGNERSISEAAARTLGEIGPDAAPAASDLAGLLARDALDDDYRATIATALGNIGLAARVALPTLLAIVQQPEPAAPRTKMMLPGRFDRDVRFRAAVILAVGRIADDAPDIVAAIRVQLASRNPALQAAALESLATLAPDSVSVVHDLRMALQDLDADIRIHAALAMVQMTVDREGGVAALIEALADEQPRVRTAAAVALGKIGPPARAALPALHEALRNDSGRTSMTQLQSMAMLMMRTGAPQIPELRQLSLRQAVLGAMARIDPLDIEGEDSTATVARPGP